MADDAFRVMASGVLGERTEKVSDPVFCSIVLRLSWTVILAEASPH